MIKLSHSEDIKNRHHQYMKDTLIPKLSKAKKSPFKFTKQSISNLLPLLNNHYEIKKFENEQIDFYAYFENNLKDISIGEPSILRNLYTEMSSEFRLVMEILKLRNVDVTFSDYIYNLFGYDSFKTRTLFHLLKAAAKISSGNSVRSNFSLKHREEFKKLLATALPNRKKEIYSILNDKNNPDIFTFERNFYSIQDVHMTLSNVKESGIFVHGWSDYALVMSSKIRVCPYCNRQFVTPFISSKGRIRADLDHFLSKSMYPYFSMSLFNLIPSCKQCNQGLKGEKEFPIDGLHPFQDHIHDHFNFSATIQNGSGRTEIEINIDELSHSNINDFVDMFKLKPLYGYHSSHADEIIIKRQMYPDHLLLSLLPNSPFSTIEELKSFIIGYEIHERDLNNEPLNKLRHDIAVQVGLLQKKIRIDDKLLNKLKNLT